MVNNLFKLRSFSPPANLSDPNNMTAILLNNMLWEVLRRHQTRHLMHDNVSLDNQLKVRELITLSCFYCLLLTCSVLLAVLALLGILATPSHLSIVSLGVLNQLLPTHSCGVWEAPAPGSFHDTVFLVGMRLALVLIVFLIMVLSSASS